MDLPALRRDPGTPPRKRTLPGGCDQLDQWVFLPAAPTRAWSSDPNGPRRSIEPSSRSFQIAPEGPTRPPATLRGAGNES